MSIRFSIAKFIVKLSGYKKIFALPHDELLTKMEKINGKRGFKIPKDRHFIYGDVKVYDDKYHCLTIQKNEEKAKRAILFCYGGGMIIAPDKDDIKKGIAFGKDCNMDVWFPYYPLCTDHSIKDLYEMIFETYKKMIDVYEAENITVLGYSSGGAIAIGLGLYNNYLGRPLPMPRRIIASSPGCCPNKPKQIEKMNVLNEKDVLLDSKFMESVHEFMEHGEKDIPEFMLSGYAGDFSNMPPIDFWYGSDEVLYAFADDFIDACKKAGVAYTLNIGKEMCHCYPMLKLFPEGKEANEAICRQICS